MKWLTIFMAFFIIGCSSDDNHPPDCCKGHGKVVMCYKQAGSNTGRIMCEDGYESSCSCQ